MGTQQQERGVGYQDLLEKAEFMRRLAEARVKGVTKPPPEDAAEEASASAASGPTPGTSSTGTGTGTGSGPSASASTSTASGPWGGAGAAEAEQGQQKKEKAVDEAARYEKALEEIMKMRVSEMKKELDLLKVAHAGLMEKREFAEALAKARMAPGVCVCVCIVRCGVVLCCFVWCGVVWCGAGGGEGCVRGLLYRLIHLTPTSARPPTENQGAGVDSDDDPSEYRTVKVTRMPREDKGGASGGGPGGPQQQQQQRRGPGAGGMGGDPFSDVFNQGARRGGAGGAGPGGFGSIFDAINNGGFGGPFGGTAPGAGAGMGGFDPSILQKVMSNPRAAAAFQRAQSNPRIMKAVQEMAKNPSAINQYMNDPEIASVLKELQSVFR
jgi:hypothetical protein